MNLRDALTRTKQLLPYLAIMAFAVVVRIPFLEVPMISDEGGYAYVAHFWSDQYQPYRDIPFDRPQGIFLLYRFALAFGEGIQTIRLFAAIWSALTAVAVMICIGALFNQGRIKRNGWLGAGLFAIFCTAPRVEGFTANSELFTLLPLTLAAWFTWRRQWFWAGLAAGIATAIKPIGVSGFMLGLAWLLVTGGKWRAAARLGVGFAVAPGLCLTHGVWLGWDAYWASFVDRRLLLFSAASMGFGEQLALLGQGIKDTASAWASLALATAYTLFRFRNRTGAFLGLWILSALGGMAMGGLWHWHYFQQLIPPLAVGAGGCLAAYSKSSPTLGGRFINTGWLLAILIGLGFFASADGPFWFAQPLDISWKLYQRPAYVVTEEISQFVKDNSNPEDPIYVAFAEAEIYYEARRKAVVPQLFFRDVQYSDEVFTQVIDSLAAGAPVVVVVSQDPPIDRMSRQQFVSLLERNYDLTARAGPLRIWLRNRILDSD